ncbi:MAG TPA: presqualene diphosphate synthase HpnD [Candidatus Dormibacteraeota bacterium]|nr:presqualene diphosphate synthase HpnD [Candidatus Dormibacteraeota bacterium]
MREAWERSDGSAAAAEIREAERFCRRMARREAKNFYWGFISLPREQRTAIYALYDFARQVDDEADGSKGSAAGLRRHRERAHGCALGLHSDPVTLVLARAVDRYGIPERELQALIDGVEMDLVRSRYATWEELERYCRLVASTVGRMCVRVFGFDAPVALELADQLGVALQLTNILRDVREDAGMGRVYLPAEDLDRFGVDEAELLAGRPGPGWEALVAFEAERARGYFDRGLGVLHHIPRRPAACVETMAGIYRTILRRIERQPRLPLERRVSLSPARKLALVAGSWARRG